MSGQASCTNRYVHQALPVRDRRGGVLPRRSAFNGCFGSIDDCGDTAVMGEKVRPMI